MKTFTDKVALVTGAANGIGRATAIRFAEMGASVVVSDVDTDHGERVAKQINDGGGEAIFVTCDIASEAEVHGLIQRTLDAFGRVDFAFNNAGWEGAMGPIHTADVEAYDRLMAINLRGTFLCMRYEIEQMLAQGGGSIVNNSSIAGLKGFAQSAAYSASKHGVIGLTKCGALDYATSNIRVNAVCPGVIETEMIRRAAHDDPKAMAGYTAMEPVKRMGRPEEVASVVTWLCSDDASFVTGATIEVDGGVMAG